MGGSRWRLAVDGAAKHALRGEQSFLSTGTDDFGLQLSLQGRYPRHAFYLAAAFVRTDGKVLGVRLGSRVVPTLTAGYELALTSRTSAILQLYASQSAIRNTNLEEIDGNKYEASLGLRTRRGPLAYALAVTENVGHLENTPDIGVSVTVAWLAPARRSP